MIGPRTADMIAEAVVAMEFRASAEDVARMRLASLNYPNNPTGTVVDSETLAHATILAFCILWEHLMGSNCVYSVCLIRSVGIRILRPVR